MFEEVVKDLNPADVFNWTGRFDPEEGAIRLKNAAFSILAALSTLGQMVPDDPMTHDALAHNLGLPGGKSFRLLRDCLCHAKLLEKGNLKGKIHLIVTEKGHEIVEKLKQKLVDDGVMDAETGKPIEKENVVPPGAPKDEIAAARQRAKRKKL